MRDFQLNVSKKIKKNFEQILPNKLRLIKESNEELVFTPLNKLNRSRVFYESRFRES